MSALTHGIHSRYPGCWRPVVDSSGGLNRVWSGNVPRIPDVYLDCVIYLFKTAAGAEEPKAGTPSGSGFLVRIDEEARDMPGANKLVPHVYAVTCAHVVEGGGCVVSLNSKEGKKVTLPTNPGDWLLSPSGDDVAVCHLDLGSHLKYACLTLNGVVSLEMSKEGAVSIGDEVFMVGRFAVHAGKERNIPVVRFGNVAMMPWETIEQPRGHNQLSYLAEMRSLPGLSGSPVFLYQPYVSFRDIKTQLEKFPPGSQNPLNFGDKIPLEISAPLFLGIDWGTLRISDQGQVESSGDKVNLLAHSGFAGIIPAWQLTDLLLSGEVKQKRQEATAEIVKAAKNSPATMDFSSE